ncbi:glycerol dehydrogenase [uncultured Nocardioides sp.]|uniref:glycerol dehydrogenase n=1 Tax=uncultured Nocardioides sp. TaxID=198441 RepID=UPI002628F560|nr:glycerol dehydrogenase [uncultured Nocardioides sp.]
MSLDQEVTTSAGRDGARPEPARPPITFISPSRYVQGPGEIARLAEYVREYGEAALVITSEGTWSREGCKILAASGSTQMRLHHFSGESTAADIDSGEAAWREVGSEVVVGLGGGKVIDTAKAIAHRVMAPLIIVPTLASTDAPCSSLSVVYDDDGEVVEYLFLKRNPDLVLVDSAVVASAPAKFLAAGMADALSTRFESAAAAASGTINCAGGRPSAAALALGAMTWDVVRTHGLSALRAVARGVVTPAVELVIEVNTLHSGLGFESGGYAAAHAVHNGLLVVREISGGMHGERVNFGVLVQLMLERRPESELDEFITVTRRLGLPVTLEHLGASTALSEDDIERIAVRTCAPGEGVHQMPFPVTPDMVAAAVQGADEYARDLIERQPALAAPSLR